MKPPSRKHYEKTKPTYKEMESKLSILEHKSINDQQYIKDLTQAFNNMRTFAGWFDVLRNSEVMVVTTEGLKYLVKGDLEDYCRAEIEKQGERSVWWGSVYNSTAGNGFTQILIDESREVQTQLDAYAYTTKGKHDTRSQS